jgi:hypothetical protein
LFAFGSPGNRNQYQGIFLEVKHGQHTGCAKYWSKVEAQHSPPLPSESSCLVFFFFVQARGICSRCTALLCLLCNPCLSYCFRRSHFRHQSVSSSVQPERPLVAKGGTTWARCLKCRSPRYTCRKSTTWDRRLYFPSKGRRSEDFVALKNPMASAGFEPANLGTKGQHATSRPLDHRSSLSWT